MYISNMSVLAHADIMPHENEAGIEYNLDVLQETMAAQGWDGGLLMHGHICFFADTTTEPRQRISCRTVQIDDRRGVLFIDRCEVLRHMKNARNPDVTRELLAMKQLIALGGENPESMRYPFNLMSSALNVFTNSERYCFVRILYEITTKCSLTNNFACLVPFVLENGTAVRQTAWNGCWWESMVQRSGDFHMQGGASPQFMSVISSEPPDGDYSMLMSLFCTREVMSLASSMISQFLTPGRRERSNKQGTEMIENYNDLTYVEFCMMHIPIPHMHCFLKKKLPSRLVWSMMGRLEKSGVLEIFGTESNERVEVFKIDLLMAAIVSHILEVEAPYRPDYNGEDIGTRFDRIPLREKGFGNKLISGDDCEGMCQTFVSFEHTLHGEFANRDFADRFPGLCALMTPPCDAKWGVFVARGTCLQNIEQNHTFSVVLHKMTTATRIHVVETVSSQVVVPSPIEPSVRQLLKDFAPSTSFIEEASARSLYQHVCVMDDLMVFEFGSFAGAFGLHFGGECFYSYKKHFVVCNTDEYSHAFSGFKNECSMLQESSDCQGRLLLLITQEAYMHFYKELQAFNCALGSRWKCIGQQRPENGICMDVGREALNVFTSGVRSGSRFSPSQLSMMGIDKITHNHVIYDSEAMKYYAPDINYESLPVKQAQFDDMKVFYKFTRIFTWHILSKLYNEDTVENDAWVQRYFEMHADYDSKFDAQNILTMIAFVGSEPDPAGEEMAPSPCRLNGVLLQNLVTKHQTFTEIADKISRLMSRSEKSVETKARRSCIRCLQSCERGDSCLLRDLHRNLVQLKPHFCGILNRDLGRATNDTLRKIDELSSASTPSPTHYRALFVSLRKLIQTFSAYIHFNKNKLPCRG